MLIYSVTTRYYTILIGLIFFCYSISLAEVATCREPNSELAADERDHRKFIIFGGEGGGIGNSFIFFPAVYYFAAVTGREILIVDNGHSTLGEFCNVIHCGYPMLSEMSLAYPSLLAPDKLSNLRGAKGIDFRKHITGESLLDETIIRGDGYKYHSEWWMGVNDTIGKCIQHLTGCTIEDDVACFDRHAYQRFFKLNFISAYKIC
jgi:hypothetical protein